MKKLLVLLLMLSFYEVSFAKYLIQVKYHYKLWSGHGVNMYYSEDDLVQLYMRISRVDTMTEKSFLEAFLLPMHERNYYGGNCVRKQEKLKDVFRYFKSKRKKVMTIENKFHSIEISIIQADYEICSFLTEGRFPCNCNYNNTAVLVSRPRFISWRKNERKLFSEIRKQLQMLVAQTDTGGI